MPFFFKQWGGWLPDQLLDNTTKRGLLLKPDGTKPKHPDDLPAMMDGTFDYSGWQHMSMVGKTSAGAELDGREHREFPR